MKQCNEEAKQQCEQLVDGDQCQTIDYAEVAAPAINNSVLDKNINVLIREVDAKACELEATKDKGRDKHNWIDREAQNCFHRGVGARMLKCVVEHNYYGERKALANKGLV